MAEGSELPEDCVLNSKYVQIPLEALNSSCRRHIALHLNLEGSLNEDVNLMNDFRGLAEMVGFGYLEIKNFEREKSPTEQLLEDWTSRPEFSPTVGNLWSYLMSLARFDVLTDSKKFIERDCDKYIEVKSRFKTNQKPIQDSTVSQTLDHDVDESAVMTVNDVIKGIPTIYDAFVCYNPEGEDLIFVRKLIEKLEDENGLKLFVPWRDDLPGASHNTVTAKLIEHRCRRMIIVISPSYLQSSACDFQTKFAHGLSPGSRNKKLIPVLIQDCTIPEILRHITCCNYTRKELLEWFWTRLVSSLKAPLNPSECKFRNQTELNTLNLDTSSSVPGWSDSSSSQGSSSLSSVGSSGTSGSSSMSTSTYSSGSSSDTRGNDYIQPTATYPPYLELLSASPPLPRRSNDYERISNIRRLQGVDNSASNEVVADTYGQRTAHYTQPIATQDRSQSPSNAANRGYQTLQTSSSADGQTQQNLSPLARTDLSSQSSSPGVNRRPVPPIPTQNSCKQNEAREYFC
ncbi:myeloid differentiation primary response protein MyD88-like [Ruditapes philippinarum]|uniref:myeloid differentiation primary response protein MyD88-like n=1 Tax=Ruditapes philippinarum TaxID=129788 RepID=UPI00295B0B28|nr:myeloid differentiation primary response protein MyD88-like [Ruditapes philippinarum]